LENDVKTIPDLYYFSLDKDGVFVQTPAKIVSLQDATKTIEITIKAYENADLLINKK